MAQEVISSLLADLAANNQEQVRTNLQRLPLGEIPLEKADTLLVWLLQAAISTPDLVRLVIHEFDQARVNIDPLPALTQLLLNPDLPLELLCSVVACFPEIPPAQYYVDLLNMHNEQAALRAAGTLNVVYRNIPSEDWQFLYRLATEDDEEDDNPQHPLLAALFESKMRETGQAAVVPPWLRDYEQLPTPKLTVQIPSVKEAVDLLVSDLERKKMLGIVGIDGPTFDIADTEQIRQVLIGQYAIATLTEKLAMLSHVRPTETFDSTPYFREYGPVNTLYTVDSEDHDSSHPCGKYGGCRMFLCTEFEEMDSDGTEVDIFAVEEHVTDLDWWRESCDVCQKRISSKYAALRLPLVGGGWRGCHCSEECLKSRIPPNATAIAVSVGRMLEQLKEIGIRQR